MSTRVSPNPRSLESAFADFHTRNFMCPEPDCEWGVVETGEIDPDTLIPITVSCACCGGKGFLPRKAA